MWHPDCSGRERITATNCETVGYLSTSKKTDSIEGCTSFLLHHFTFYSDILTLAAVVAGHVQKSSHGLASSANNTIRRAPTSERTFYSFICLFVFVLLNTYVCMQRLLWLRWESVEQRLPCGRGGRTAVTRAPALLSHRADTPLQTNAHPTGCCLRYSHAARRRRYGWLLVALQLADSCIIVVPWCGQKRKNQRFVFKCRPHCPSVELSKIFHFSSEQPDNKIQIFC